MSGRAYQPLTFADPDLEREFVRQYDRDHRRFIRLGSFLSMGVWISVSLAAYYLGIPHAREIFLQTLVVLIPLLAVAAGATLVPRLAPAWQWIAGTANLTTALMLIHLSRHYFLNLAFLTAGMILMSIYAVFIFRLRLRVAIPFTMVFQLVVQAFLVELNLPDIPFFISTSMIWGTLFVTSMGGYYLESAMRRLFINTRLLAERNREIEGDLVIARRIVDTLLSGDTGSVPGCVVRAAYRPMDRVGGDFYDINGRDGRMDLCIADVSGHGLASSYLALVTRLSLDRVDRGLPPGLILAELNRLVHRSAVNGSFVTAFYATIDPAAMTVCYAAAGHHPALLLHRATGIVEPLTASGRPLGWFPEIHLEEGSTVLKPGDRLVIYTDGITECRRADGDLYGEERLEEFLRESANRDAAGMTGDLLSALAAFSGRESFDDDLTLLVTDLVP